ncbi:MAG: hypothetical protein BWY78_00210 [Alphaproteobacteria bacterium ADurb.Bin438]|nr:MAG: hypothetical protein BWY78_00210 [Alphaproteobacteria bacterium ADurb.Bin438]
MKKLLLCTVLSLLAFNAKAEEGKVVEDFISREEVKEPSKEPTQLKADEVKAKGVMVEKTLEIKVENKVDENVTKEKIVKVKTNELVSDDKIIETKEIVEQTDVKQDGKLVVQEVEIKDREQTVTEIKTEQANEVKQEVKQEVEGKKNPIARYQFTTKVEAREPTDKLEVAFYDDIPESLVFFNEIVDFNQGMITYTWFNGEKEIYSRDFKITSDRYRLSTSVKKEHFKKGDSALVVIKNSETGDEILRAVIEIR